MNYRPSFFISRPFWLNEAVQAEPLNVVAGMFIVLQCCITAVRSEFELVFRMSDTSPELSIATLNCITNGNHLFYSHTQADVLCLSDLNVEVGRYIVVEPSDVYDGIWIDGAYYDPAGCFVLASDCKRLTASMDEDQSIPRTGFFRSHPLQEAVGHVTLAAACCGVDVQNIKTAYEFLNRWMSALILASTSDAFLPLLRVLARGDSIQRITQMGVGRGETTSAFLTGLADKRVLSGESSIS
jgi:hypothetical protein